MPRSHHGLCPTSAGSRFGDPDRVFVLWARRRRDAPFAVLIDVVVQQVYRAALNHFQSFDQASFFEGAAFETEL